jgi:hypothetical protein
METSTLEDLGFENLVYYDTYDEALTAFMDGSQRFIASDFFHLALSLPSGYFMDQVQTVTRFRTVYNYIAFSKDVSDAVVNRRNRHRSHDKESTVHRHHEEIHTNNAFRLHAGNHQIYTEASPPSAILTARIQTRKVEGSSVDIVNEIQARTGHVNKINMSLWIDAYAIVQYLPNSSLFNTTRTPEREICFNGSDRFLQAKAIFIRCVFGLDVATMSGKSLQSIAT